MESALTVALLAAVVIALTSTTDVTGTPTAGFLGARVPDSGLSFGGGGGMGFGQQIGAAADRIAQRVSETLTAPFKKPGAAGEEATARPANDETKPADGETKPADGETKPEDIDKRIFVPGFDAVTSGPQPEVKPQSTAAAVVQDPKPAHDDKATPPGNKLETTTESRFFVDAASKCGENQAVDPGTRKCLDAKAAPDES